MKNIKKIIIIVMIIIVLIVIGIIILRKNKINNDNNEILSEEGGNEKVVIEKLEELYNNELYYMVKKAVNKYFDYAKKSQQDVIATKLEGDIPLTDKEKQENWEKLKRLIDAQYIKEYNISNQIYTNQISNYKDYSNLLIEKISYKDINDNLEVFVVPYKMYTENQKLIEENTLLVRIDRKNETFSIIPHDYIDDKNENISNLLSNIYSNEIIPNIDNKYTLEKIEDAKVISDYMMYYKKLLMIDLKKSYDILDEEYKNKRFNSYEEYQVYVQKNMKDLQSISIQKYKNEYKGENESRYICIDKNNNYYLFNEKGSMDFTLSLDTYTLDLDEFLNKYNVAKDEIKVGLNSDKIIQAINMRDYKYVYNKLDETFKNNNFKSEEVFENYMINTFPLHYTVEYSTPTNENNIFVQKIKLENIEGTDQNNIEKAIIMQLKEGTDFVMSFDV